MDKASKTEHKKRIHELHAFINSHSSKVTDFDEILVNKLLESITIYQDYQAFKFNSGVTVSVEK